MAEAGITLTTQNSNLYIDGTNFVPTGSIICYAGSVAPDGWLVCDGRSLDRALYANLFSVIGTAYGSSSGNNFMLPNLAQRFPMGKSVSNTLGGQGGSSSVTLSTANMPAHTHSGTVDSAGAHDHVASTAAAGNHSHAITDPGHTHSTQDAYWSEAWGTVGDGHVGSNNGYDDDNRLFVRDVTSSTSSTGITVNSAGDHTHNVTVSSGGNHVHTFTTGSTGSGTAIDVTNPYVVLNYIIRV